MQAWGKIRSLPLALVGALGPAAQAELALDGSMGLAGPVTGPNYRIGANMGQRAGANLFHSFAVFDIAAGEKATFSGPSNIDNVVARVSGGRQSRINGTIASDFPDPVALWLINPAGWVFGEQARLDVNGSFYVSSADYLGFADGSRFQADPAAPSTLSFAPPQAYGFSQAAPARISIDGSLLRAADGGALGVVGGEVTLSNAQLKARDGHVLIGSLAAPGQLLIQQNGLLRDYASVLGSVSITQDAPSGETAARPDLDVSGVAGGGSVQIETGDLNIENGFISARNFGRHNGGAVRISASRDISMSGNSRVRTDSFGWGRAGDIQIEAGNLRLRDDARLRTDSIDRGDAGGISVQLDERLQMQDNAALAGFSLGEGDGGHIVVNAASVWLRDNASMRVVAVDRGDAGDIRLDARQIDIRDNGSIDSATFADSTGRGGNISIQTSNLYLAGSGALLSSSNLGVGQGGDIRVSGDTIGIAQQAQVRAESIGQGAAGSIELQARDLLQISDARVSTEAERADGGPIHLRAGALLIRDSQVTTSVEGAQGNGGDITIDASALALDNGFVQANTAAFGARGGDIVVNSPQLVVTPGSLIVGGQQRLVFQPGSGISVIQAAAPDGVSGEVSLSAVELDISGELANVDARLQKLDELGADPCAVQRGQTPSSLAPGGRGGLPARASGALSLPLSAVGERAPAAQGTRSDEAGSPASETIQAPCQGSRR